MGGSHYRRVPSRAEFPRGLWEGRPVELQREPRGSRSSRGASAGLLVDRAEFPRAWCSRFLSESAPGCRLRL
ncbi:unnamed protein product [Sphagnum troendelagicum]|uniref:Uncharacterized protein n=1 Tax=Sphagnum troendelagicum TaxID=128251 RepID=A0ABP0TFC7_9BRYO